MKRPRKQGRTNQSVLIDKDQAKARFEGGGLVSMMVPESGSRTVPKTTQNIENKPDSYNIRRLFTKPDASPFVAADWEFRTCKILDNQGKTVFEQNHVQAPVFWSQLATDIVASKYFRGNPGTPERETSIAQVIARIADTITESGLKQGYFGNPGDAEIFHDELVHIILHQLGTFNSPVWFNVGAMERPQSSACYNVPVEDDLESIMRLARNNAMIFKGGSGTGTNLSPLRSCKETLSGGGIASGPISFMRVFDAVTGVVKSGGRTRRAAALLLLDIDHPDILDFIHCKGQEEKKAWALIDAGYDGSIDGEAYATVSFQNANNSVRIPDAFMTQVAVNGDWHTIARTTGESMSTHKAKDLLMEIAKSACDCGDPGVQFDTIINKYNTCKESGRINCSNACAEMHFLDNAACNLASINLLKFLEYDGSFRIQEFTHVVDVLFTAQDILIDMSSYPTPEIEAVAKKFRPLGINYTNLGALLMAMGLPYDSPGGRETAASITALMTGQAYLRSTMLASKLGPFEGYAENRESMRDVIKLHTNDVNQLLADIRDIGKDTSIIFEASECWRAVKHMSKQHGFRNAQASLLAPTGCLTADAMVLSSEGLLPIAELGDPHGQTWQDTSLSIVQERNTETATKFYINGRDRTYRVQTTHGHEITGTWKHRLRVINEDGEYTWCQMQDLRPDDIVVMRLGGHEAVLGNKPLACLKDEPAQDPRDHRLSLPTHLNESMAEILGYYMGNGYTKATGGLHLITCSNDPDLIDHFGKWIQSIGAKKTVEVLPGCVNLSINGRRLYRWMHHNNFTKPLGNHGEGAAGAFVPLQVLRSRSSVLTAFLRGLFEADGTITYHSKGSPLIELTTVSEVLARQTQTALESLGMATTLRAQAAREDQLGDRTKYRIRLKSIIDCEIFAEKIGFISNRKHATLHNALSLVRGCVSRGHNLYHQGLLDDFYEASRELPNTVRRDIAARKYQGHANLAWAMRLIEHHPPLKKSKLARHLAIGDIQFVVVEKVEYMGEKETFDISVPKNNTYIANGFISHNTISFAMDCDTTGIEPEFSLVKTKNLVGGGSIKIVNKAIPRTLKRLGYSDSEAEEILTYIKENGTPEGMPLLREKDLPVFDCAAVPQNGTRSIAPMGHIDMVAAVQPFLSGASSKTINLPHDTTPEEIFELYLKAWQKGIKAMAVYRDGSKRIQPLQTKDSPSKPAIANPEIAPTARRRRLPEDRVSVTHKFSISGYEGYLTIGQFEDGTPGEMFIRMAKAGSVISGLMDGFALSISMALQYGVPLEVLCEKYTHTRFEPSGFTPNKNIPMTTSILDYIFRWVAARYLGEEALPKDISTPMAQRLTDIGYLGKTNEHEIDGPPCPRCGSIMTRRTGTCYTCDACGTSGGCG